jgi:hypothetical protein
VGARGGEVSSGREQVDDLLDGFVGTMVGQFEAAVRAMLGVRTVVEAAIGQRTAQPLMEEKEEQGDFDALQGKAVGVASAVALEQCVGLEFSQIVSELVETVSLLRDVEGGEDGLVDFPGGPAAKVGAAMQENLEQADDARIVDLDSRVADGADGDRQGDTLEERKVDVDVEPLGLKACEPTDDGLEFVTDCIEVVQAFVEAKVVKVVGAELVAQEHRELFILPEDGVLEISAEDMMTMLDLIDNGGELAAMMAV